MERATYLKTQNEIIDIAKRIESLDLVGFITAINHAETTGPILDPTLFRNAADNLRAIKNVAQSLLPVTTPYRELIRVVLEASMRGSPLDIGPRL